MLAPSTFTLEEPRSQVGHDRIARIQHAIDHAAHLLPSQGPITVFVHHNTLHSFEHLPFDEAVKQAWRVFGCEPYLSEERYRAEYARGRIRAEDLTAVLLEDLGDDADRLIGFMGTRFHVRRAMLEESLRTGTDEEIRWAVDETDLLFRFRRDVSPTLRGELVRSTRELIQDELARGIQEADRRLHETIRSVLRTLDGGGVDAGKPSFWEAATLHMLWQVCHQGVHGLPRQRGRETGPLRLSVLLDQATGVSPDALVRELLIPFCGAFLDQGVAPWPLPDRGAGFFESFRRLYARSAPAAEWLAGLPDELARISAAELRPVESIAESLALLGISEGETEEFIEQTLLELPGWGGMIWQMETNAEWTLHPAPAGSLAEFLAVRLMLDRLACAFVARTELGDAGDLRGLRARLLRGAAGAPRVHLEQRAYAVFQLAQLRGWAPGELHRLTKSQWRSLVAEIESFPSLERRRLFHRAYERRYRNQTLDALLVHAERTPPEGQFEAGARRTPPDYQVVTCIDDREESFRRHLEEVDPACETFGIAGFFGVAMYYKGVAEAHFRPLCPIVVKPRHYVVEEPPYSLAAASRVQAETRKALGRATRRVQAGSRTMLGGMLTGLLGSMATIPLILRVLFPSTMAHLRRLFGRIVNPPLTQLRIERSADEPGPEGNAIGYTVEEMAGIVEGSLRMIGLTERFAPLVVFLGHGSSSLNNPHSAAYDCGACGGGRGGPNARAFALMANDPRVRRLLMQRGLPIPDDVTFVGGYHNTCNDDVAYFDLDRLPPQHRPLFERVQAAIDAARERNAHERCRRFMSAPLEIAPEAALRHVERRAEDLSQARPECGHATNAVCFVGRRAWSRGLFLDRRTFLTSYDPAVDDEAGSILARLLGAVIPVCAGINLEYYFSYVDSPGYGCGTKLPHNVTSLLGVMDGAASDLRPGLPWQMVEIHEPVRILFVIETSAEAMLRIMADSPAISQLVRNGWVQLAVFDPSRRQMQLFRSGRFEPYEPESCELPSAASSIEWYRGQRDHLGYASIGQVGRAGEARR